MLATFLFAQNKNRGVKNTFNWQLSLYYFNQAGP